MIFLKKHLLLFFSILYILTACGSSETKAFVDVSDFGAKGDGITDDTSAIRKAVEELPDGGTLYFPEGEYLVNSGAISNPEDVGILIEHKNNINILGESELTTKISDSFDGYEYGENFHGSGTLKITNSKNITLSHLSLKSRIELPTDKKSYEGHHNGVLILGVDRYHIHHVRLENYNRTGLFVSSKREVPSKNGTINHSYLSHNRVAGLLLGTSKKTLIEKNTFEYNGQIGDGGTGYGMAGLIRTSPNQVTVRNNLAAYNVRKGIDFHAGLDLKILNNQIKGNGLYGIDVEGTGTIEIIGNTISDMNPTITQNTHDLNSVIHPIDRNRPDTPKGTSYWNTAIGIYVYIPAFQQKRPQVIIKDNIIKDFTGENPPNGIIQTYHPLLFSSPSSSKPNADFFIGNNIFNCGEIFSFLFASIGNYHSNFNYFDNSLIYKSVRIPKLVTGLSSYKVNNNTFKRLGSEDPTNYWNDDMVACSKNKVTCNKPRDVRIIKHNIWNK